MRGIFVIARRDLKTYFMSPLFYMVAGVCTIVWSFVFGTAVDQFMGASVMQMMQSMQGEADQGINLHRTVIAYHASIVNLLMIMATAALSMRLLAEEKKQRTFDLLLTSPVTATDIAVGKWLAGTLAAWGLLAITILYPVSLTLFGPLEWGPLASTYIGLMLLAGVYVSVGLFASSLTESSVLAVVMAILFNFMLFFISAPAQSADGPIERAVFEHLSIGTHLSTFVGGSIGISAVVFFASLIFLFTLLTQRVIESARWR
jgi:ABC-2 type transport system permease protein